MRNKSVAYFAGILAVAFALLAGGLFLLTREDSAAARLLREGNRTFAAENFTEALGLYQLAQNRFPALAEPFYNAANALYRQASYADAIAQLDQALQNNADDDLAQRGFYNKGNAAYNSQDLEAAIQSYIAALLLNPDDADAKHNLELALQQQQEQQQEQEQQEQEQEQQEENQESEDNQESEENQENQDSSEGEQEQESGENGEQENEQESDQSGEEGQEQNEPNQGDQNGQQPQPSQPEPGQEQPQNGMVPQPGERLTAEQARQLLTAVTQNSQTLQERLQQILAIPWPPSGQDW